RGGRRQERLGIRRKVGWQGFGWNAQRAGWQYLVVDWGTSSVTEENRHAEMGQTRSAIQRKRPQRMETGQERFNRRMESRRRRAGQSWTRPRVDQYVSIRGFQTPHRIQHRQGSEQRRLSPWAL